MATVWNTPKYDFLATDGLTYTHMNEIGENLEILKRGNYGATTVASAADLAINMDNQVFYITGTTNVSRIRYTDGTDSRANGNIIFCITASSFNFQTGGSSSGQYHPIGSAISTSSNRAYCFVVFNSLWYPIVF